MQPDDPFARLADEARAAEASREREQAAWLRRRAAEDATLAGTLVDLAEQGHPVALRSVTGRTYHGTIAGIGADFAVVRTGAAGDVWVRVEAIVAVRPGPGRRAGEASGARAVPAGARLAEALADEVGERPRVVLVPAGGGEPVTGILRSVGADVAAVEPDGERSPWFVHLRTVTEVLIVG